ncbi:phosphoglycerate mutase family protein [Clostridiaceae bacterium M8S5]|nr:phosphoglycerate mutase family protein [Clostridiaceae bacterium M8S5]
MTKVYFVRHAQSDISIHDELTRPLTPKGEEDARHIVGILKDKNIDIMYSSPYKRSIDTIAYLSKELGKQIKIVDALRERMTGEWIEDFDSFAKKQWMDLNYKTQKSESLKEVQERNINALEDLLKSNQDKNIVIATHGTALSTILNYYNSEFGYKDFERIRPIMPFIICLEYEEVNLIKIEEILNKNIEMAK